MVYTGGEGYSCSLGRCCFGIPTSVHWSFWAIAIVMIIFAAIRYRSWEAVLLTFLIYVPLLLLTILIHEVGHIARNRAFGGTCSRIVLWPLGGFSNCNISCGTIMQEFWVAFCGPITHIPQLVFWWIIMIIAAPNSGYFGGSSMYALDNPGAGAGLFFAEMAKTMIVFNIMLLVLNFFVPAYPLDGARMLAALLVQFGCYVKTSAQLVGLAGLILGLILTIYGIIATVTGTGQGLFLLLIGVFCLFSSSSLLYTTSLGIPHSHPLYAPDCYRNAWIGGNPSGGPTHAPHPYHTRNQVPPARRVKKNPPRTGTRPSSQRRGGPRPGPGRGRGRGPGRGRGRGRGPPRRDIEEGGGGRPRSSRPPSNPPPRRSGGPRPKSTRSSSAPRPASARPPPPRSSRRPQSSRPPPQESPF